MQLFSLTFKFSVSLDPVSVRHPPHHRNHVHKPSEKTTRVRTVLNEKQLHTLRTCYNANPRPDALMKEQLVEMTGLSPRVIRVWFQNKRCKDKKRSILMKQLQQQQHNDKTVSKRGFQLQIIWRFNTYKHKSTLLRSSLSWRLSFKAGQLKPSNNTKRQCWCLWLMYNNNKFIETLIIKKKWQKGGKVTNKII